MKINIIRLQDNHLVREILDTALLFSIEFMLDGERCISAIVQDGILYVSSPVGRLRITPRSSNAIFIEITE